MSFPTLDLPPELHHQTRNALVREATRSATRRRMPRFAVPAVALAVVAVVLAGLAVTHWIAPGPLPASKPHGLCNATRPGARADAKGLTYVFDVPEGWSATAKVELVRYCQQPLPVADYWTDGGQMLQVFDQFSLRLANQFGDAPKAAQARLLSPLGPDDYGAGVHVPYTPVEVAGRKAKLIRPNMVAWKAADGHWWTALSGGLSRARLLRYAGELKTDGSHVSWPGLKGAGFRDTAKETRRPASLPEGSWQPLWTICLREHPGSKGACSIAFHAARWDWWSPDGSRYPPAQAILDSHKESRGGGWTSPKGVVMDSTYGPDRAVYRKAVGSVHLVPVNSDEVAQLLGAGQEGTAPSSP